MRLDALTPVYSTTEEVINKFNTLRSSSDPIQLIKDCTDRAWRGAHRLEQEQVILPLAFGVISGLTTLNYGKAALNSLVRCELISAVFYGAITYLAGYATMYNLNQLANITYDAGDPSLFVWWSR